MSLRLAIAHLGAASHIVGATGLLLASILSSPTLVLADPDPDPSTIESTDIDMQGGPRMGPEEPMDESIGIGMAAEIGYCGGDMGYSAVDDAEGLLYEGAVRQANLALAVALREGNVQPWERGRARSLLAETQLRLGRYRQAAVNFRRAASIVENEEGEPAIELRIGLAVALHAAGRRSVARRLAEAFVAEHCEVAVDPAACFGAHYLLSISGRTAADRSQGRARAVEIREANPEYQEAMDMLEQVLRRTRPRRRGHAVPRSGTRS